MHYHFGSISALARAAGLQAMGVVFEPIARILFESDDLLQGLDLALRAALSLDPRSTDARVVLEATVHAPRDPELARDLRQLVAAFRSMLTQRLAAAQAQGLVVRSLDPIGASVLIAGLLDGVGLHHLLDPASDLSGAAPALRAMLEASHE